MTSIIHRFLRQPETDAHTYYHVLDLARGLAACSILIWHYQHFVALGMAPVGSRGHYPFYRILAPFYEQGGAAVQLFWIISGFVFSAVYLGSTASSRQFFVNRLGRLYPLHLLTLVVVAMLQLANGAVFGEALIYQDNDAGALALQLFMASGWTNPVSFSFNGPVWSVSAELLVYALFWLVRPLLFRFGVVGPLGLALLCLSLGMTPMLPTVWLCGFYFFIGCAIFVVNRAMQPWPQSRIALAAGMAVLSPVAFRLAGQAAATLILFAAMVLLLTSLERFSSHRLAQRLGWLGDSTYGIYLWHIPVQLAALLVLGLTGQDRSIALGGWFLLSYVALVLLIARMSFLYFERPMRGYVRRRFAPGRD